MAEVPAAALGCLVEIEERGDRAEPRRGPARPRAGSSNAEVHPDRSRGGPQHRAEQGEPDGVAGDLDGEGLGRCAGDGEVGQRRSRPGCGTLRTLVSTRCPQRRRAPPTPWVRTSVGAVTCSPDRRARAARSVSGGGNRPQTMAARPTPMPSPTRMMTTIGLLLLLSGPDRPGFVSERRGACR